MTPGGGKTGAVVISWGDDGRFTLAWEDTSFSFRNGVWVCISDGWGEGGLCLEKPPLWIRVL